MHVTAYSNGARQVEKERWHSVREGAHVLVLLRYHRRLILVQLRDCQLTVKALEHCGENVNQKLEDREGIVGLGMTVFEDGKVNSDNVLIWGGQTL